MKLIAEMLNLLEESSYNWATLLDAIKKEVMKHVVSDDPNISSILFGTDEFHPVDSEGDLVKALETGDEDTIVQAMSELLDEIVSNMMGQEYQIDTNIDVDDSDMILNILKAGAPEIYQTILDNRDEMNASINSAVADTKKQIAAHGLIPELEELFTKHVEQDVLSAIEYYNENESQREGYGQIGSIDEYFTFIQTHLMDKKLPASPEDMADLAKDLVTIDMGDGSFGDAAMRILPKDISYKAEAIAAILIDDAIDWIAQNAPSLSGGVKEQKLIVSEAKKAFRKKGKKCSNKKGTKNESIKRTNGDS